MESISSKKVMEQLSDYISFCQDAVESLGIIPGASDIILQEFKGTKQPVIADIHKVQDLRQQLIQIKINHTANVVAQILSIAKREGMPDDLQEVLDIVARLHDIGRFFQGTLNNTYNEGPGYRAFEGSKVFANQKGFEEFSQPLVKDGRPVLYHNEAGEILLESGKIPELSKNEKLAKAIKDAVFYHQKRDAELPDHVREGKINIKTAEAALKKLLTTSSRFSESQRLICAFLTQLVKDVDGLDILHQHLTGEFPVIRPVIGFNRVGPCLEIKDGKEVLVDKALTLEELIERWCHVPGEKGSEKWEKSIAEIKAYLIKLNDPQEQKEENVLLKKVVNIPVINSETNEQLLNLSSFKMPADLERNYNDAIPMNLQVINKRIEYNPAVGMCWRLQNLLGGIRFSSNMTYVLETELLDNIFKQYPEEVQRNLKGAFEVARQMYLGKERIQDGSLYTAPAAPKKR